MRAQARRHGVTACFMAKPIEDYAGSGMHFHVSLRDATGTQRLCRGSGEGAGRSNLLHALGGLSATMAGIDAGLCPARQFLAPLRLAVLCAGGADLGRQQPLGRAARAGGRRRRARRIEHRPSGVDANPYLVAATVLAGIAKGLDEELDPGPGDHRQRLRGSVGRGIGHAARLALGDRGGQDLGLPEAGARRRTCTAPSPPSSTSEYLRVARTVSELDYHLYLHEV